jgi:hypothetical protein
MRERALSAWKIIPKLSDFQVCGRYKEDVVSL